MTIFDYQRAFSRNRGLVSAQEQERLRRSRVLVLGAGGVGGGIALTLARTGIGKLRIADPDTFDLVNFNRQMGATVSSLGQPKASTIGAMIRDINPEAEVDARDLAFTQANAAEMLSGVDLLVDGLDFFCVEARLAAYAAARRARIPVVSSGPIGMSATMHLFTPDGMSFERYFDLRPGDELADQLSAFLVGVTPRTLQRPYMDLGESSIEGRYGPSLNAACMICAGVVGVESLRVLLGRGGLRPAPHFYQFDAYRRRLEKGYLRGGNRHPLQRVKRAMARRMIWG